MPVGPNIKKAFRDARILAELRRIIDDADPCDNETNLVEDYLMIAENHVVERDKQRKEDR